MAYVKIEKVKYLSPSIKYVCRDSKTNYGEYIDSYACIPEFAAAEFEKVHNDKRIYDGRNFSVKAWVIYQSFKADEVSPEHAHKLGIQLADKYLGNGHQRIISTHNDTQHVHNHIIFNAVNYKTLKCFDSKTKHIISDLRRESNNICEKNNLSIIKYPARKGCSQREYCARKNNRSYKAKIEGFIELAIQKSSTMEEFFIVLREHCEVEERGKNYSIKLPGQKKPTRLSRLGFDYSIESIRSRIGNKELIVSDSSSIFEELQKANNKHSGIMLGTEIKISNSVESLLHIATVTKEKKVTSTDYIKMLQKTIDEINDLGDVINETDREIDELENYIKHKKVYEESRELIRKYKAAKDKPAFKKAHSRQFRKYDETKKFISAYREDGVLPSIMTMQERINTMRETRNDLYEQYTKKKTQLYKTADAAGVKYGLESDSTSDTKEHKRKQDVL